MDDNTKDWLQNKVGLNLERDLIHDAAGINDDWPVGRGVFVND